MRRSCASASKVLSKDGLLIAGGALGDTCNDSPKVIGMTVGNRAGVGRGKRKQGREKIEQGSRTASFKKTRSVLCLQRQLHFKRMPYSVGCGLLRASFDDRLHATAATHSS